MCGISGFFTNKIDFDLYKTVSTMTDSLRHRGPDSGSVWTSRKDGIGIGHRRLAVVDLSSHGRQPMNSTCGRYVLSFNGELYNHLALRAELENSGFSLNWRGHSDTETLLACISVWGLEKSLQAFEGMFAFSLWDNSSCTLTLARDRFGEKPLYYGWVNGDFVFGSELKAIRSLSKFDNPIDRNSLALYFQYCVVPSPYSIYKDIYKLEPGCFVILDKDKICTRKINIKPYWKLIDVANEGLSHCINDDDKAIKSIESVLHKVISKQSIADVPLGSFLSGGVDSSIITAVMQSQSDVPIQTFTIGFDEKQFDESHHALLVAKHLGTDHHELNVTSSYAREVIPLLPSLYDEPFSDSSQIPTYLVCKVARQHVTVALSGDGGDELFGGYNRYLWGGKIWNKVSWIPLRLRNSIGSGINAVSTEQWDSLSSYLPNGYKVHNLGDKAHKLAHRLKTVNNLDDLYRSLVTEWNRDENLVIGANNIYTKLDNSDILKNIVNPEDRMMLLDGITYLPDDILTKVDRAAMGVSLETRVPFLDHNVAELAWRLPMHMKIRNGQGKWALRQVLYKYVPKELIERPKAGFGVPVGQWLRGALQDWAEELLEDRRLNDEGYLNTKLVRKIWNEHQSGRHDWTARLWSILMFQSWLESQK